MQGVSTRSVHRVVTLVTFGAFVVVLCLIWILGVTNVRHLAANLLSTYFLIWGVMFIVSKTPKGEICARFALSSAALLFVLVCLEGVAVLGLVDYRTVFGTRDPWLYPGNIFDEELQFKHESNLRVAVPRRKGNIANFWCLPASSHEYQLEVSYDSNGFRNDPDPVRADIVVIGDSYIEGNEVSMGQLATSLLAKSTQSTVVNLGHAAYGPRQQLVVLKRYALPLKPDVVVWAFYEGNDLRDTFTYDEISARLARGPKLGSSLWQGWHRSFSANSLDALFRAFGRCEQNPRSYHRYAVFPNAAVPGAKMYFLDGFTPMSSFEGEEEAWQRTIAVLSEAFSVANNAGIQFVIVFIPNKVRVYRNVLEFPEESEIHAWKDTGMPRRLAAALAQISPEIGYVDLTPHLVAEAQKGKLLYFLDDTHWMPEGHRVAAQAIHEFLSITGVTLSK